MQNSQVHYACSLGKIVSRRGVGIFTGQMVEISLVPLPEKSGVFLQRMDLPGQPKIPLKLSFVQGTPRCTIVGNEIFSVQTVEHLMAALHAYRVENLLVQLNGVEVPIFDGSSSVFVEMIEEAGVVVQEEKQVRRLNSPVYVSKGETSLVALPAEEFRISYTLQYANTPCIGTQFFSVQIDQQSFKKQIASCRTFSVYEEIAPLIEKGLLKGGNLENAVVVKSNQVMNPEGLRFPDEMVRHKILDIVGDLFLVGVPFLAHILAVRSGHHANNILAEKLLNHFNMGNE